MRTDHEVAQAVLQGLEWSSFVATAHPDRPGFRRACPICSRPQPFAALDGDGGHAGDCLLAAALAGALASAAEAARLAEDAIPPSCHAPAAGAPCDAVPDAATEGPQTVPRLLDRYRHAVAVQTASRIRYGGRAERPAEKEAEARSRLEDAVLAQAPASDEGASARADRARIAVLEERLAAAYEIVGSLAYGLGQFHHPKVIAALDYLAELDGAASPLPFPSLRPCGPASEG